LRGRLKRALRKGNQRRIDKIEADLALPPFPKALAYIWRAYFRLRRRTAGGFAGPNPIGWQDIDAFSRQTGLRLAPWEIDLLETLDDLYLAATLDKQRPQPQQGNGVIASASFSDGEGVRTIMSSIGVRKTFTRTKDGRAVAHG
jgi:hypothetical protein